VNEPPASASIRYEAVPAGYFEDRGLRRHARVWSLWALGVGAVISGDFFGWSYGLEAGGFGGLFIALVAMTVMYAGLCFSIAEMSPALPHAGGAYSFARSALGPWGGYVTGLAENMEYILTPSVIVVGIGSYLGAVFGHSDAAAPLWWLFAYGVCVSLNIAGVEISFRFTVVSTLAALAILTTMWIGALQHVDFTRYALDIPPNPGATRWLPHGVGGVLGALPFAMWFYLAIEELPLAAEESHEPSRDMPRGIIWGLFTLVAAAFLTLVLSTSIPPGANALRKIDEPIFAAFTTIFGDGMGARLLALVAVTGLVASFHAIVFAYGRQIYSMARAGYFPRWLSLTHPRWKTPYVALIAGAVLGYAVALTVHVLPDERPVGAILLKMAVFGAVLAYVLQMVSFIVLRIRCPQLPRPYRSPLGVPGAVAALLIALVTLVTLFASDAGYGWAAVGALVWYLLGLVYFVVYARHHLVYAPEERFAVEQASPTSTAS